MQSLIFFFLCFFIHFLHCMEQTSSQVNTFFEKLKKDHMEGFRPSLDEKNEQMYFFISAKSDFDNPDSPITILKRTFDQNTAFYAYVNTKRNEQNVKDLMQAKISTYTLFITPPVHLQGQVFTFLIDILKKNPLIFQHAVYKDVRILDILFNVRVNIKRDFSEMLKKSRFIIDIVNVFPPNANIDNKPEYVYDYKKTREYTRQLAIFLMRVLEKKFDINSTKQETDITLQKAFQVHPWVWVSQTYYAKDDVNNFNEQYNKAFFNPNINGPNEPYEITSDDLKSPVKRTFLYNSQNKIVSNYKESGVFTFILKQRPASKNYFGIINFDKDAREKSLNDDKRKFILNISTNNYFIVLAPTVENSQLVVNLLNKYKTENPVIYKSNSVDVYFNDIVFDIIKFSDQRENITIAINNIAGDAVKNFKNINTVINVECTNVELTKEYTEKLLVFLHQSFEKNNCLKLPSGVLGRFNILPGLAHIKDIFFVTQCSLLTKKTLKKEHFDEKYNYAYFKSDITGESKEYPIDQNLFNNPERINAMRALIPNSKKPASNMQAFWKKLYAFLQVSFVLVYTVFAWLFM